MFVPDPCFGTLVGFVEGINLVTGELGTQEFSWWICDEYGLHRGPLHWSALISQRVGFESRGWTDKGQQRDWEREAAACEELLDRVEEFLARDSESPSV